MFRRQKARFPQALIKRLRVALGGPTRRHDDERGQVVALAAEAVGKPRAEAGLAGNLVAGLDVGDGGVVIDGFGVDAFDDGEVVRNFRRVLEQFAEPACRTCRIA